MEALTERFLRYVSVNTQSDPNSGDTPSTKSQMVLAKMLVGELQNIGMQEVTLDQNGYIMASLPSNTDKEVPVIGFISHMDTSPDYTAEGVKPRIVKAYQGDEIVLNPADDTVLSPDYFEDLLKYKGGDLIVTDGTTLLGADNKAGIAEIITAMDYLIKHPEIKHGTIRVGFTPDEEIGRGAHKFDVDAFGADWAYTVDGGEIGELEYENFNAAGATITVRGKSVHPGYAKGKMVNAARILVELLSQLPQEEVPERTSGREGFFHIQKTEGSVGDARAELLVRDHDSLRFEARKEVLRQITAEMNRRYGNCIALDIRDQYFNMKEKVEARFGIVEIARKAMEEVGIEPRIHPIRGGTDGSQLSFMGLPCPNIFAGGHNFHGQYEFIPINSMKKAVEVIVKICELTTEEAADGKI